MNIPSKTFWIALSLLSAPDLTFAGTPAEDYESRIRKMTPAAREAARSNVVFGMKMCDVAQTTNSYRGLTSFLASCQSDVALMTNATFLMSFVQRIRSRNPAALGDSESIEVPSRVKSGKMVSRPGAVVIRQDIFIQGGRAAWCLERLLHCDLPEVSEASSDEQLEEAAIDAHYCVVEAILPPDAPRSVAGLTLDQKRHLAESESSNAVILAKLSKDENKSVRMAVAANNRTSVHILGRLGYRDKDEDVKKVARQNLRRARMFDE